MRSSFAGFSRYAHALRELATAGGEGDLVRWSEACQAALNGQPGHELRSSVTLEARRAHGTFFTGSVLAQRLVRYMDSRRLRDQVFLDPACGAGDLLLAVARYLPLKRTVDETVSSWGRVLHGVDREPSFVSATKARLVLLARQRLGIAGAENPVWSLAFPLIYEGDALRARPYTMATRILLNPPFARTPAPTGCLWGDGNVNAAAVFLDHAINKAQTGTEILAILPEVLRTGSRYAKWRGLVARRTEVVRVEPYGVFDDSADVHVFMLVLSKRARPLSTGRFSAGRRRAKQALGDYFDVGIGAVVPYRDPNSGPLRRYVHPRNVPAWSRVLRVDETRRFEGSVAKPPFVVIRRTSRPGDKFRATAAMVLGGRPVAVENHLVVCKPRDGLESTCKQLMTGLKTKQVNKFLDGAMRCRHLTVGVVRQIPVNLPQIPAAR